MPSRNTLFYSQAACFVVANGRTITDFYEGEDSIAVVPDGDQITRTKGLGGAKLSVASYIAGDITIKLKPTSPECTYLDSLAMQQAESPILFDVTITTGVNEVVNLSKCMLNIRQHNTGGATMQVKEYSFIGSDLQIDTSAGADSLNGLPGVNQ